MALSLDHILNQLQTTATESSSTSLVSPQFESQSLGSEHAPCTELDQFFGLQRNPFAEGLNTEFLFETSHWAHSLDQLTLAIRSRVPLVLVQAPSGCGKSLLSQVLLRRLLQPHPQQQVALALVLAIPQVSCRALLGDIALELGLVSREDSVRLRRNHLWELLQGQLLRSVGSQHSVLLLDEAHFLTSSCLHLVRSLTNLENEQHKLLTCVLFAEPFLWKRLQHPRYASLKSRVFQKIDLQPLSMQQSEDYLTFRTLMAGAQEPLFEDAALQLLVQAAQGSARCLNQLGFQSLVQAYLDRTQRIDLGIVQKILQNFSGF